MFYGQPSKERQRRKTMFPKTKKENGNKLVSVILAIATISALLFLTACEKKEKAVPSYEQGFTKGVQSVKPISINQQAENVAKMVKENPIAYQEFLQKMVDIACRNNPGLALQVEQYASAKTKRQMEQLLEDASVQKLAEQKSKIDSLNDWVSISRMDLADMQKQIVGLRQENASLKTTNAVIAPLQEQAGKSDKLILALRKELADADSKYNKLAKLLGKDPKDGVPVLLTNKWVADEAVLEIFNKDAGKEKPAVFLLQPNRSVIAHTLPGNYIYNIYSLKYRYNLPPDRILWQGQLEIAVTDDVSYCAPGGGKYNGHIEINK